MSSGTNSQKPKNPITGLVLNFVRGILIGIAEIIPGISGGTIALITGVYNRIINSAAEAFKGLALLFTFSKTNWIQAGSRFRSMSWSMLIPMLIGMVIALFAAAGIVEPLLEQYPTLTKALFAGLIAASLVVPIRLSGGRWGLSEYAIALVAAVAAFAFTSIPRGVDLDPGFWLIAGSAAIAVCALVLPGVSGSYLLLALGMYAPTIAAVNDRDFGYLGTFVLGALVGLGLFVGLLQWLLQHKTRITLVVMSGLMVGSLRALWPWQSETGEVLAPQSNAVLELVLFGLGAFVVAALIFAEKKLIRS
jgi:putative membrane protein